MHHIDSKLESGNAETLIQNANLQETLDAVVHLIKTSKVTEEKRLKICTSYDYILPQFIETDSRRIQQILYNLLGNAIKFGKENSNIEFCVKIIDLRILRFTIKDYGKGIDQSDHAKIFEPFQQTSTGLTNVEGGTGLGLAITKKLVKALNGKISVESDVGSWTKFTVDFPFQNKPVMINDLTSLLISSHVFVVSETESDDFKKAIMVLDHYSITYSTFLSMRDLAIICASNDQILSNAKTYACICQENLYDEETFRTLSATIPCCSITFGPDFSVERSNKHFRALSETFPSVLVQTIVDFVEELTVDPNKTKSKKLSVDQKPPWSNLNVMIAEDNSINQKVLARILSRLGVERITVVNNGEEAVKREALEAFDLILMDMQMPVMDGIQACKEINARTEGDHPKAKVVFATAHVSDTFRQTCLENGASGYLPKPCTIKAVEEVLAACSLRSRN